MANHRALAATSGWAATTPRPGWNVHLGFRNPRTPAVPATLDLTLEEYFAAAALVGLLSAQQVQPDMKWASQWASEMGAAMAAESRKRRRKR